MGGLGSGRVLTLLERVELRVAGGAYTARRR